MKRIQGIDFMRGLVMIIMALDHVRDLMHISAGSQSPTDLSTTTPALFFTRWITYLCAPVFVFLAGTSAFLSLRSSVNFSTTRRFLLKRGLWLILVEFTVFNLALFFDPGFHTIIFEVIAAIGFGFIVLYCLANLSYKTIGIIGIVILLFHNLLQLPPSGQGPGISSFLSPLFRPGAVQFFQNRVFVMAYPPIPWLGIMLVGFASGKFFVSAENESKKLFIRLGAGTLLLFLLLRFINIYGDPAVWSTQKTMTLTILSFLNVTKYPPSLQFCLLTLGVMFIILSAAYGIHGRISAIVTTYGKVPLFYFIMHFYLIHFLLIILLFLQGFNGNDMEFASGSFGRPTGRLSGIPLWAVYFVWVAVVVALYWPCRWYSKYKATHKNGWVKYL